MSRQDTADSWTCISSVAVVIPRLAGVGGGEASLRPRDRPTVRGQPVWGEPPPRNGPRHRVGGPPLAGAAGVHAPRLRHSRCPGAGPLPPVLPPLPMDDSEALPAELPFPDLPPELPADSGAAVARGGGIPPRAAPAFGEAATADGHTGQLEALRAHLEEAEGRALSEESRAEQAEAALAARAEQAVVETALDDGSMPGGKHGADAAAADAGAGYRGCGTCGLNPNAEAFHPSWHTTVVSGIYSSEAQRDCVDQPVYVALDPCGFVGIGSLHVGPWSSVDDVAQAFPTKCAAPPLLTAPPTGYARARANRQRVRRSVRR
eukprot:TRINITY_DN15153_c0_g1_i8.p1 TRINITY_DN15153_c0_g1~~TRINITY_DN15153_c0_g1_i8.p1  ORF type:complete len:343 (+),score=34.92 TRINITY_DN15153_c0_g1_i8:74-1030(+)